MRTLSHVAYVLGASAALALLTDCNSGHLGTAAAPELPQGNRYGPAAAPAMLQANRRVPAPMKIGFVSDAGGHVIYILDGMGKILGKNTNKTLKGPVGMSTDKIGNLYVANLGGGNVLVFKKPYDGDPITTLAIPDEFPTGVAVYDKSGEIAVTDFSGIPPNGSADVEFYNKNGKLIAKVTDPAFPSPRFGAYDKDGNFFFDDRDVGTVNVGEVLNQSPKKLVALTTGNVLSVAGGVQINAKGQVVIGGTGTAIYTYNPPVNGNLGMPVSTTLLKDTSFARSFTLSADNVVALVATEDSRHKAAQLYSYPGGGAVVKGHDVVLPGADHLAGTAIVPTGQFSLP